MGARDRHPRDGRYPSAAQRAAAAGGAARDVAPGGRRQSRVRTDAAPPAAHQRSVGGAERLCLRRGETMARCGEKSGGRGRRPQRAARANPGGGRAVSRRRHPACRCACRPARSLRGLHLFACVDHVQCAARGPGRRGVGAGGHTRFLRRGAGGGPCRRKGGAVHRLRVGGGAVRR